MQSMGWETASFYALGAWALVSALLAVTARDAVRGALALASALVAVAGLFALERADLVAFVQLLVFAGGVAASLVFAAVVRHAPPPTRRRDARRAVPGIVAVILLGGLVIAALGLARPAFPPTDARAAVGAGRNAEEVAGELFGRAAVPLEIAGVLLLVAVVASALLARERS
jgi:NADH:ubiquinone oxidoreductase subunit 6 (subunit J)